MTITQNGLLFDNAGNLLTASSAVGPTDSFVLVGDSRTAQYGFDVNSPTASVSAQHYFAWANSLLGMPLQVTANLGISGIRSDQFIAQTGAAAIASPAQWVHVGPPVVNDIGQALSPTYTTVASPYFPGGVLVTMANVAAVTAGQIKAFAMACVAAGKKVLLSTEHGSTAFTAAQVAAVFQFNEYLRYISLTYPNIYLWDGAKDYWNPIGSTTAIVFRAGYSGDGIHSIIPGGYAMGVSLSNFLGTSLYSPNDYLGSNAADIPTTNSQSLIDNGLFTTLTGGTATTIVLTSGTIPANWTITGAATSSVVVTSAANANGYGNDLTLALTAGAADSIQFSHGSFGGSITVNDKVSAAIQCQVAAGSSNFNAWQQLAMQSPQGSPNIFSMYGLRTANLGSGPTTAYTTTLYCPYAGFTAGSASITLAKQFINFEFAAAGSATVTLRRAIVRKQLAI